MAGFLMGENCMEKFIKENIYTIIYSSMHKNPFIISKYFKILKKSPTK